MPPSVDDQIRQYFRDLSLATKRETQDWWPALGFGLCLVLDCAAWRHREIDPADIRKEIRRTLKWHHVLPWGELARWLGASR